MERFSSLIREFNRILNSNPSYGHIETRVDRFYPTDFPAVVTLSPRSDARRRLQRLKEHPLFGESFAEYAGEIAEGIEEEPLTLHLNAENPLIERLAAMRLSEETEPALVALFNNATLLSSQLQSQHNLKVHYRQTVELIDGMLGNQQEIEKLRAELKELRSGIWKKGRKRDDEGKSR